MTKPDDLTPEETLLIMQGWVEWAAAAVLGVSFDPDGNLGFRTGRATEQPEPFSSVNPGQSCPNPKLEGPHFMSPRELHRTLMDVGKKIEEETKKIQRR
jgi:hypothetical protein